MALNVATDYRCRVNSVAPADMDYTKMSGEIGGTTNVTLVSRAGSPFSSTYDEGQTLTVQIGGVTKRVRVVNRVDSVEGEGEWSTSLLCVDTVSLAMAKSPFPKPLNYMTMDARERTRFNEETSQSAPVFTAPRDALEYSFVIKLGDWWHQQGLNSTMVLKDLVRRSGLAGLVTNLPKFDIRELLVAGTYFDAIMSLVAPFQPIIYESGNLLYVLDYHTKQVNYGWRGSATINNAGGLTREAGYEPLPPKVIVQGSEGPFVPSRYKGPTSVNAGGAKITAQTLIPIPVFYTPPNHAATTFGGLTIPEVNFRGSSWAAASLSIPSYGPLIATITRPYAVKGMKTGDGFLAYDPLVENDRIVYPEEVTFADGQVNIENLWDLEEHGGRLKTGAFPSPPLTTVPTEPTEVSAPAAKIPSLESETSYYTMDVYSRSFFNTKGDLWYSRRAELTTDATTGVKTITSVVEKIFHHRYTSVGWVPSVLESSIFWDADENRMVLAPCEIHVEWGWVTAPDLDTAEAASLPPASAMALLTAYYNTCRGAAKVWAPIRVTKVYREYYRPWRQGSIAHMSRATESALQSAEGGAEETNDFSGRVYFTYGLDESLYLPGDLVQEVALIFEPVSVNQTIVSTTGGMKSSEFSITRITAQESEEDSAVITAAGGVFMPPFWPNHAETARASGSLTKRNVYDVCAYPACLVEKTISLYRPLEGRSGYQQIKSRLYRDAENAVRYDSESETVEGPLPNTALAPRMMDIQTELDVAPPSSTASSSDSPPVVVSVPFIRWKDADEFAARLKAYLLRTKGSRVRWTFTFPAPLFLDVGWIVRVNKTRFKINNAPSPFGSGDLLNEGGVGIIVEHRTRVSGDITGAETTMVIEE